MTESVGDAAQTRRIAEQVAKATIVEFVAENPDFKRREAEIPAPLKWAAGVIAGLFTMGIGAMAVWLVTTVNDMQMTLVRMDERLASQASSQVGDRAELERRIARLETYHATDGARARTGEPR